MAKPFIYTANELFEWLCDKPDFILLDVRNEKEFANWSVEGPHLCPYINIPYFNFIEDVADSIAMIPKGEKVRVVCSKEGSAKYVAEQLIQNGIKDVGYLKEGIVGWGNALVPRKVNTAGNYELYQCIRPGKASCSYMLINGGEAFVFDPSRNIEVYTQLAESKGAKILRSFDTHRQADYISGCQLLKEATGCTISVNQQDFEGADFEYDAVQDGNTYPCGGVEVKAIHTPGHTMGSTCFQIDGKFLISGDTIFIKSAGRPDLGGKWEEWSRVLYLTLFVKLRDLDDDLIVLPGHFVEWDEANDQFLFAEKLGILKQRVDAYQMANELQFKAFVQDNMRQQPGIYTEIRRVNGGWLKPTPEEADIMDLGKNECSVSKYGKIGVSAESQRQSS
ncbi:MAG: MBL fold metallo-hydrolase [Desulfobulbaceae bacterium]|nr:MBL fold metallo-hydrolase [Desulfobulbaceae bacterium]